ncbi:hypothetical protein LCGC14_2487540 [marine sediment metagenome]|uniref:Uncharacterized protein n=1 Tax=marine sediment metagenome TaxID=412755 RepID=A0A0F9BTN9_9ZZZZ
MSKDDNTASCPNCGYCPHCGKSNGYWTVPYVPSVPYFYPPYMPFYPTWTSRTTIGIGDTFNVFSGTVGLTNSLDFNH